MGDNGNAQPSTSVSFFSEYMVEKHGRKPLRSKEFVLDLENERDRDSLKKDIKHLGGTVLESYDDNGSSKPFCIVTDHPRASYLERLKSGKVAPQYSSNLPVVLRTAVRCGIRVRAYSSFRTVLTSLKNRVKLDKSGKGATKPKHEETGFSNTAEQTLKKSLKRIRKLTPPFIKLEDNDEQYSPSFKEFGVPTNVRPIYIGEAAGRSLFHKASPEYIRKKKEGRHTKPRAKSHRGPGYCDICARDYPDLRTHFSCNEHQKRISEPGFYDEVDALCGSYTEEIAVPNKPLRKRLTPEPLPLPLTEVAEVRLPPYRLPVGSED